MRATKRRRVVIALATCAVVAALPIAGSHAAESTGARASKPDAASKRCQAALRRVERQHEALGALDARIARNTEARTRCESRRKCERLDHVLKADDARRTRYARQLAQYEVDATGACAGAPR